MFDDQGAAAEGGAAVDPGAGHRLVRHARRAARRSRAVKNAREAEKLAEEERQRLKQETTAAAARRRSRSSSFSPTSRPPSSARSSSSSRPTSSARPRRCATSSRGSRRTKVQLEIVSAEVGLVTKNDVLMAGAAGAVIIGFNTKLENGVTPLAKHHSVRIETFDIIYELGDQVREMMADLLEPDLKETKLGAAEVRATFPLAKGFVAGCLVTEGKINRNAAARLRRGREIDPRGQGRHAQALQGRRQRGAGRPGVRHQARRFQRLPGRRRDRVLRNPEGPRLALTRRLAAAGARASRHVQPHGPHQRAASSARSARSCAAATRARRWR